ncbi:hypothetical protein B5X24_HaOG215091 [Helicoverpa armigera]|uniref:Uncharacterized protein n=1 Tax=Helicoverpa armigera TaxID=29058 RepID=A0A2W1B3I6_HELAM|nr:hypothetical protein B5X24_HaOG215091 [Helicoverpa armigera]
MNLKIPGALKRIYTVCFRGNQFNHKKCQLPIPRIQSYPNQGTIKLATVQLLPNLKLLSFRVSKNFLYFSFARPGTDLLEFIELCSDEV